MGRAELTTHTRLPLRNDRKAEPCHKDAFIQQHVTHFYGSSRLADNDGDDWSLARQRFEPCFADRRTKIAGAVVELFHELRMMLELPDRAERACGYRRRQRVREELRT